MSERFYTPTELRQAERVAFNAAKEHALTGGENSLRCTSEEYVDAALVDAGLKDLEPSAAAVVADVETNPLGAGMDDGDPINLG